MAVAVTMESNYNTMCCIDNSRNAHCSRVDRVMAQDSGDLCSNPWSAIETEDMELVKPLLIELTHLKNPIRGTISWF